MCSPLTRVQRAGRRQPPESASKATPGADALRLAGRIVFNQYASKKSWEGTSLPETRKSPMVDPSVMPPKLYEAPLCSLSRHAVASGRCNSRWLLFPDVPARVRAGCSSISQSHPLSWSNFSPDGCGIISRSRSDVDSSGLVPRTQFKFAPRRSPDKRHAEILVHAASSGLAVAYQPAHPHLLSELRPRRMSFQSAQFRRTTPVVRPAFPARHRPRRLRHPWGANDCDAHRPPTCAQTSLNDQRRST